MRRQALHDALRDFALEASALLTAAIEAGAEVGFEVTEERGRASLYRYRTLTARFIGERWPSLRGVEAYPRAAEALGAGAAPYLRMQGLEGGADPEPALHAMLERLWEDADDFRFPEERFERVYGDVERTLFAGTYVATIVAPLAGIRLERGRVDIADGVSLVRAGSWAPSEATAFLEPGDGPDAPVLCMLERDMPSDLPLPYEEAAGRFRTVLTALRLLAPAAPALGALAFGRADEGPWQPAPLAGGGRGRREPWRLPAAEEADLRELMGVLARSRLSGPPAWALDRLEMGLERASEGEALSDYLLALRAMLDGGDEVGRASMSLRLAALCSEEDDRRAVARRVETAFALERFLIGGGTGDGYLHSIGPEPAPELIIDMEEHLRTLLRGVAWGYLEPNLRQAADDVLLASGEPLEIRVRDMRGREAEPAAAEGGPQLFEPEPEPAVEPDVEAEAEAGSEETHEFEAVTWPPSEGVTPSTDWSFDDDPGSYGAPV